MSVSHGGFEREYLNRMGVSAYCQQTWKVGYVFVMMRKWGKGQKDFLKKLFLPLSPILYTAMEFYEYESQLENFKEDKKNGKNLSSKYILCSSGSNLISVKTKNKALPVFGRRLARSFSGALFRNGPSGQMQCYIMPSSSFPQRNCSCFEALEREQ